jgi:hypothetical protein
MSEVELLRTIQPIWVNRVVQSMTRGAGLREDLRIQAESFFTKLEQALETGDPAWLDPILTDWSLSLTLTDLEVSASSVLKFTILLQQITIETCQEVLDDHQALLMITTLLPIFHYIIEKSAQLEM